MGRKHLCQLSTLRWQQKDGLDTVLPYGLRRIQALRTLTTESTAVLIPFRAQEILQPGGIYYGQNAVSKNMIVADRTKLLNGNSFRLGVSGSGKSMSAKEELVQIALATEDDILILDPESEFGHLTRALGGEVIQISATSDTHINALDMDRSYGDERNPIVAKSEFVLSLYEQLVGGGQVTAKEKSILAAAPNWSTSPTSATATRARRRRCGIFTACSSSSRSRKRRAWRWPANCSLRAR